MAMPGYKDIVDLIKKGATLEAQEKLITMREAALELQEENLQLRAQVSELLALIKQENVLTFDGEVYWFETDDGREGPFCPKCKDSDCKQVRLHKDGHGWWCHTCSRGFN